MPDEFTTSPRTKARKIKVAIKNVASEVLREGSLGSESSELEVSQEEEPGSDTELMLPSSHRFRLHAALKRVF